MIDHFPAKIMIKIKIGNIYQSFFNSFHNHLIYKCIDNYVFSLDLPFLYQDTHHTIFMCFFATENQTQPNH